MESGSKQLSEKAFCPVSVIHDSGTENTSLSAWREYRRCPLKVRIFRMGKLCPKRGW